MSYTASSPMIARCMLQPTCLSHYYHYLYRCLSIYGGSVQFGPVQTKARTGNSAGEIVRCLFATQSGAVEGDVD